MKKAFFFVTIFFTPVLLYCQDWHLASDILRYPSSTGSGEVSVSFINSYDTVLCKYKLTGSSKIKSGYKLVLRKNGFYMDDFHTVNVFFNVKKHRIQNVSHYFLEN